MTYISNVYFSRLTMIEERSQMLYRSNMQTISTQAKKYSDHSNPTSIKRKIVFERIELLKVIEIV